MQIIKKIEIRYLRSLYSVELSELSHLNVISGLNDVGKSNILKALNLFFNSQVDWLTPFDFENDLSFIRREEGTESSKESVWVAITFYSPASYTTLPPTFRVRRQWNRWHEMSELLDKAAWYEQNNVSYEKAVQSASRFIRSIDFKYVPAVKDKQYFEHLLSDVKQSYMEEQSDPDLEEAVKNLNKNIAEKTKEVRAVFEDLTGIQTDIEIPTTALSILKAAGTVRAGKVPLTMRGDGIQVSYIPALLYFISKQIEKSSNADRNNSPKKTRFIWGFEEPENSLEYGKALALAQQFMTFANEIQIFVTTHSPAFIALRGKNISIYRVYRLLSENKTVVSPVYQGEDKYDLGILEAEMGLLRISEEMNKVYVSLKENYDQLEKQLESLLSEIAAQNRPVVYVEGENDVLTLNIAWRKCFPDKEMSFTVKSCDPFLGEGGGGAGTSTLGKLLEVIPKDSPYAVVGVFDRDKEGISKFKSLGNFGDVDNQRGIRKATKGRRVGALIIPIPTEPEDRSTYAKVENLPLELYFSDKVLEQGGIEIKYSLLIQGVGNRDFDRSKIEELGEPPEKYFKFADDAQKASFARRIANKPNKRLGETNFELEPDEFKGFIPLFELIEELLAEIN